MIFTALAHSNARRNADRSAPDRSRWAAPLVTVAALLPIGVLDVFSYGVAAMGTDGCDPNQPCPPALQINEAYGVAAVVPLVLLAGLGLAVAVPGRRPALRWLLCAAALLCVISPVLSILGGNPQP